MNAILNFISSSLDTPSPASAFLKIASTSSSEAGIAYDPSCQFTDVPANSYPGKLTQFLYRRFQKFGQEEGKGFIILSCELIYNNGKELERCVLKYAEQWNLGEDFCAWVKKENTFCSTLVDRIVTGYPRNEAAAICEALGYEDNLIDTGEIFGFWVIEGPQSIKDDSVEDLVHAVCTNEAFWGEDLTQLEGFEAAVCNYLTQLRLQKLFATADWLVRK